MARLRSKIQLIDYVKSQLGAPTINVEVTNTQIGEIIDDTIQKFTEYAYGDLESVILININGAGEYILPDTITNIIKLSKGAVANLANFKVNYGGYVPNIWSEQFYSGSLTGNIVNTIGQLSASQSVLDKYFGQDLVFNFNHLAKKLQIHENFHGPIAVHYQYEYIANDSDDMVFNHEWIKGYTLARTKFLWGNVTGKYTQSLVGGAQINYDRMLSEGQERMEKLEEELLTKWSDPAPIDVA